MEQNSEDQAHSSVSKNESSMELVRTQSESVLSKQTTSELVRVTQCTHMEPTVVRHIIDSEIKDRLLIEALGLDKGNKTVKKLHGMYITYKETKEACAASASGSCCKVHITIYKKYTSECMGVGRNMRLHGGCLYRNRHSLPAFRPIHPCRKTVRRSIKLIGNRGSLQNDIASLNLGALRITESNKDTDYIRNMQQLSLHGNNYRNGETINISEDNVSYRPDVTNKLEDIHISNPFNRTRRLNFLPSTSQSPQDQSISEEILEATSRLAINEPMKEDDNNINFG